MIRTFFLAGAMLVVATAAHAGQPVCQPITVETFTALKMGSSYAEAVELFGCEGEEMSRVEMQVPELPSLQLRTMSSVIYVWRNPDASSVTAMFNNDRMISRGQVGLVRNPSSAGQAAAKAADQALAEEARTKLCQRSPRACQ